MKMKSFIGLLLMLLIQKVTFAQSDIPPSLADNSPISAQKRIDHLNDIAFNIYLESPDSARKVAEKALLIAEREQYSTGIGRSFLNIGRVYWSQSYYPIALFYVDKALMILPKDQPLLISSCYNVLGRIYSDLNNNTEALYNLTKAEQFADKDADKLAEVFSERSLVYTRTGNYEESIANVNKALALNRSVHDQSNEAVLYGRLSRILELKKDYKGAIAYSDTAYMASIATHNKRLRATTNIQYASIYYRIQDYDKAIVYAKKGAALGDSIGVVDAISCGYKILKSSFEKKHDLQQAMLYQNKYAAIQDSLSTFNKGKNTQLIQDYFALNTKLNDLAAVRRNASELQAKMEWQSRMIISLSLSLVALMVVLSMTWYFYKQKKQAGEKLNLQNEALTDQKQIIEAQAANLTAISKIKDKLLAVIAHDLRTPLANLRNISDMFDEDYLSKEEVQRLMKDINPIIKGAELTLSNLLAWAGNQIKGRNVTLSQLDIFLLGVEMEQTFIIALQKKNIEFVNHGSPGKSVLADENHIKVVLRNLIGNAIKFTETNGHVILNSDYEENKVIISVQDNGKGMSQEEIGKLFYEQTHFSQRGTSGENGIGIGLLLCKDLVELNGGKIWIVSEPGKGSTFFFSLPLNAEYA